MKFEDYRIAAELKASLLEMGFKKPTDIQFKAITPILKGEDVLAIAQTGTGKTAAFVIPVLDLILQQKRRTKGIHTLVMAPTHELALQIVDVFLTIGKHTKIRVLGLHGSTDQAPQIAALQKGPRSLQHVQMAWSGIVETVAKPRVIQDPLPLMDGRSPNVPSCHLVGKGLCAVGLN